MNELRCTCCGMPADSVLETPASGVSFLCESCSESIFFTICQGAGEHECTI